MSELERMCGSINVKLIPQKLRRGEMVEIGVP